MTATTSLNRVVFGGALTMLALLLSAAACAQEPIVLQAEDAQLNAVNVAAQRLGYQGAGYVYGFKNESGRVLFRVEAKPGFYDLVIRYWSPVRKGYTLVVNAQPPLSGLFFPCGQTFMPHRAGLVELTEGVNTLVIEKGWGYYNIDAVELTACPPPAAPPKPPATLADPRASDEAKKLMSFLVDHYGKTTFSGVMGDEDLDYVKQKTGVTPAIFCGDLIECSPSRVAHGAKDDNTAGRLIERHKQGHIVTLLWHWNAPANLIDKEIVDPSGRKIDARWYKGFEKTATTFDLSKALDDPNSEEHRLLLRDIDVIAGELRKLADAKVPVLWRPLHEADGEWFWWGASGPERFVQLWRLLFDRLTNHHGLHNLIWVYTGGADAAWYPGDDCVDVIGVDAYPDVRDYLSEIWTPLQARFAGKKLLALTEFGGVPDVPRMQHFGVWWSYFVSWTGPQGPKKMSDDDLVRIYRHKDVANHEAASGRTPS